MARPKGVSAVLVLLCLGLFAYGCGDDGVTQEDVDDAVQRVEDQQKLDQLQKQVDQLKKQSKPGEAKTGGSQDQLVRPGSSGSGGPVTNCADGVRVGANTSCDFAMNVAGEKGSNPGASTISAYSPVTGEYYTMSCGAWSGGGTVCTGGNGASVYLL